MITGKSFEDLRKAPSESDKIKLESERTKLAQEQDVLEFANELTAWMWYNEIVG